MSDTGFMRAIEAQEEFVKRAGVARRVHAEYARARPPVPGQGLVQEAWAYPLEKAILFRVVGVMLSGGKLEIDRDEPDGELVYQFLADVFGHSTGTPSHELWQYVDVWGGQPRSHR